MNFKIQNIVIKIIIIAETIITFFLILFFFMVLKSQFFNILSNDFHKNNQIISKENPADL